MKRLLLATMLWGADPSGHLNLPMATVGAGLSVPRLEIGKRGAM